MSSGSGDGGHYSTAPARKAKIAPWPFVWPTFAACRSRQAGGLPVRHAASLSRANVPDRFALEFHESLVHHAVPRHPTSCRASDSCWSQPALPVRRAGAGVGNGSVIVAEQQQCHRRLAASRPMRSKRRSPPMPRTTRPGRYPPASSKRSSAQLTHSGSAFRPRLAEINGRLEQLGPRRPKDSRPNRISSPANGRRSRRKRRKSTPCSVVAEDLSIRINGSDHQDRRHAARPVLAAADQALRHSTDAFADEVADACARPRPTNFYRTVSSWLRFVVQFKLQSVLAATFFALVGRGSAPDRRQAAVRPFVRGRSDESRTRPISAGCRSRSGRR